MAKDESLKKDGMGARKPSHPPPCRSVLIEGAAASSHACGQQCGRAGRTVLWHCMHDGANTLLTLPRVAGLRTDLFFDREYANE
jgi:hypothetical protein